MPKKDETETIKVQNSPEAEAARAEHGTLDPGEMFARPKDHGFLDELIRRTKELRREAAARKGVQTRKVNRLNRHTLALDSNSLERITAGLPLEDARRIFKDSLTLPGTLYSTDARRPGLLKQLAELLHDPITVDEAAAINDVLYGRQQITDMLAWLRDTPVSWDGYFTREKFRREEADRKFAEYLKRKDELWAKEVGTKLPPIFSPDACAEQARKAKNSRARPCPQCGTPPEFLEWYWYWSPPSQWRHIHAGWKSRCRFCLREIDYFIGMMGTGRRPDPAEE